MSDNTSDAKAELNATNTLSSTRRQMPALLGGFSGLSLTSFLFITLEFGPRNEALEYIIGIEMG